MNSKKYIFNGIQEEIDLNEINPINGQKSPIIKPKLDDTLPSILNLSSEMSTSLRKQSKNESFHIDDFKINNNLLKFNNFFQFNSNSNFIKSHYKAYSNEVFGNPNTFNFLNMKETEKNIKDEEEDNSSYYEGAIHFDEVINFWEDNNKEENEEDQEKEENKKKVIIDYEDQNENQIEEDINEGFDILNMLQKGKKEKEK